MGQSSIDLMRYRPRGGGLERGFFALRQRPAVQAAGAAADMPGYPVHWPAETALSIETLFATPFALPTVPKVVQQLIQSFEREDITVGGIAEQLAADPVLSAKTLRLANSAYFHASRQIATVDDALRMLGFVMVRNLVLGLGFAQAFKDTPGLDLPQFWRYSVHSACGARWLAQAGDHNADMAFTVGLVHGLGQLVMHAVLRDKLLALDRQCPPLAAGRAAAELAEFGYHHGEVGAELARRWKFPAAIAAPLAHIPAPAGSGGPMPMAALVHLAVWRARAAALATPGAELVASCPRAAAAAIGWRAGWLEAAGTLSIECAGQALTMPPLAELSSGLEALVD